MGSFVHGVSNLSPVTLNNLGVPEEAQMTIANMHLRLRNNTPYITGALKFAKWPTLDVTQPAPFVEFYSLLGSSLIMFHIALMPFNGIQLEYEEHGLCIPGLGHMAYQEQSQALWSIINTLLPATRADIKSHITSTRSTQDGYRLLWLVGSQVVRILSRLQSVPEPRWSDNDTVFSFGDTVELYKILRRMRGQGLDDKEIGIKFLIGVRGKHQALAQSMAHQLSKVDISRQPLPLEWTLSSMADTLNTTVTGSVLDEMRLPQLRQKKPTIVPTIPLTIPSTTLTLMTPVCSTPPPSMPPPTLDTATLANSVDNLVDSSAANRRQINSSVVTMVNGVAPHCSMVIALPVAGMVTK